MFFWFGVEFNINYSRRELIELSPGERGIVLLIFYLALNKVEEPIIIDQPEDNLDNESVFKKLAPCIIEAKKRRQVVLVTHNPNIVVGADSEEVIIANQNGKNSPNTDKIKFQYKIGGLEYSSKRKNDESIPILDRCGIREHVCDILEGGEKAFRDGENKYGFFKI